MGKARARDDSKYGRIDDCCAARTPIKLPTWGHIGQICLELFETDGAWSCFEAGRKATYKNIALSPTDAQSCVVALMSPSDNKRYGFLPPDTTVRGGGGRVAL